MREQILFKFTVICLRYLSHTVTTMTKKMLVCDVINKKKVIQKKVPTNSNDYMCFHIKLNLSLQMMCWLCMRRQIEISIWRMLKNDTKQRKSVCIVSFLFSALTFVHIAQKSSHFHPCVVLSIWKKEHRHFPITYTLSQSHWNKVCRFVS